jgi:hypothetical protein
MEMQTIELISRSIESDWKVLADLPTKSSKSHHTSSIVAPGFRFILSLQRLRRLLHLELLPPELTSKIALMTKKFKGGLLATSNDIGSVPIRDVPLRIEPISSHSMPPCDAIESADAIELQLSHQVSVRDRISLEAIKIDWPNDTASVQQFGKKLQMLQRLAKSPIPIGVSLPISVSPTAVGRSYGWLTELPLDFVNLRMPLACLAPDHFARSHFQTQPQAIVGTVREMLDKTNQSHVAIGVDYPWVDGYHAGATCAAGASFVSIDGYLAQRAPMAKPSTRGSDPLTLGLAIASKSVESMIEQSSHWMRLQNEWDLASDLELFALQFASVLDFSL